jgi:hypothetical protein
MDRKAEMAQSSGTTIIRLGLGFLLVSALLVPAAARGAVTFETGDFIGTVVDNRGAPVAGVDIYAQDVNGKVVARATTDRLGSYLIPSLVEGEYHLTLDPRGTGYQGQTIVAEIAASGSLIVDWRLSVKYPARTVATPAVA